MAKEKEEKQYKFRAVRPERAATLELKGWIRVGPYVAKDQPGGSGLTLMKKEI